jgi:hypothetical protein
MLQDIRLAARQILRVPGFSVVIVLTLALAIGANTAIFSAVDAVLLHPLPYPDPDRLVTITENLPHYNLAGLQPSFSGFLEYRRLATCFSEIAAVKSEDATLTGDGQPEEADGRSVTSAAFGMLEIKPVLGGLFTADDEQYGKHHVVILSESLWKRRYGGDRAISYFQGRPVDTAHVSARGSRAGDERAALYRCHRPAEARHHDRAG